MGIGNHCVCGRHAPNTRRRLMFGAWKSHCHCLMNHDIPAETTECGCENPFLQSEYCHCASCFAADAASFGKCDCFVTKCGDLNEITYLEASAHADLLTNACGDDDRNARVLASYVSEE